MRTYFTLLPWFAASLIGTAYADVHKCVDAAGQVSFQDQACPDGSQDSVVHITAPPPPPPSPASQAAEAGSDDTPAVPPPLVNRIAQNTGSNVPTMWLCTRPEDGSQFMSRDGVTPPRMVPAGVLGVTNKSLGDAYSGPNGVGVSAPGVRPIPIDRSAAGSVAGGYVAVQDRCEPASQEQACSYLQQQYDRVHEKLRRAFKDERAVLEPQEADLEQQMKGC
jgi:hypothetical protein